MDKEILAESERILKDIEGIGRFGSKYNVYPYRHVQKVLDEIGELVETIPDIDTPENRDELVQAELKRRLTGDRLSIERQLSPKHYDFETIVSALGIPRSDLNDLRNWLLANRDATLEAIERIYNTNDVKNYELGLSGDIPSVRRQAEEFAAVHIQKYHGVLGRKLQQLTKVGEFLRDINAVSTTKSRSYFHPLTNTLAIGISAICFSDEDRSLHIRERDLITLYGHEGMGHALNQVVTKRSGLPYFLTRNSELTTATMEAVAQFYQRVIFEDLRNSSETQRALGIEHKFAEIYQEARDIAQLNDYQSRLSQYAIIVLADKELGDPQDLETLKKKTELLSDVTLSPSYPLGVVESNRYGYDSQGNLNPGLVGELIYAAQPVKRALAEFARQGITYENNRSRIDEALLKGFWTPIGFVDNARLKASED